MGMTGFQAALAAFEEALEALESGEGDHGAAEGALDVLRQSWKELPEAERQATLPEAQAAASRLRAVRALELGAPKPLRLYDGPRDPESLLDWFGYPAFRPGQREAVSAALEGQDCLVVMPTGGGKTLCYQLPGMATERLTVVVSPLVALIEDQYTRLRAQGHPAVMLAAERDNFAALDEIRSGAARMVFASPERFSSRHFLDAVSSREQALFVVDEAHCISEWGHDFRPDYLRLSEVLERLGRPPVMACTATATPQVAEEIVKRLGLQEPVVVRGGFDRPNISFDVIPLAGEGSIARKRQLLEAGLSLPENRPAVVYCGTRKDVEEVSSFLSGAGLRAGRYHAGLEMRERQETQAAFMGGELEVIVATNAFGMGVDKADVRSVWHWALPTSLEAYYQEAGRAGRDGRPARAVLLSLRADLGRLINFNKRRSTSVEAVEEALRGLKRQASGESVSLPVPLDDNLRLSLSIAERAGAVRLEPASSSAVEVLLLGPLDRGRAHAACQVAKERGWQAYRAIEAFSAADDRCRRRQLLDHFADPTPGAPIGRCCSVCDPIDWLPELDAPAKKAKRKAGMGSQEPLRAADLAGPLAERLKAWRLERAEGKPAYTVCANATLAAIIEHRPRSKDELLEIHGVGPGFIAKHSESLLEILATA